MNFKQFGDDLTYPTPKVVQIKDPLLGALRYATRIAIFLFIVVFHIMYRGSHLSPVPVNGVARLQLRDPSENSCDPFYQNCTVGFTSLVDLPYCNQNNFTGIYQKPCEFWDSVELRQMSDEGLLIPTRTMRFQQHGKCTPNVTNGYKCESLFDFVGEDGEVEPRGDVPKPVKDVFVADVERFDMLLDHSATSAGATSAGVQAYDFEMVGHYLECPNQDNERETCQRKPVLCVHGACPEGAATPESVQIKEEAETPDDDGGAKADPAHEIQHIEIARRMPYRRQPTFEALEPAEDDQMQNEFQLADAYLRKNYVVSTTKGDMFQIGNLVKSAGVDFDANVSKGSGMTFRNDGFALVVRIEYTNTMPWIGTMVSPWHPHGPTMRYTYRITTHATGDVKFRQVHHNQDSENSIVTRTVDEFRGVRVVVQQVGSIQVWNTMQLMFLVTTTLALLAVSDCCLDMLALRCVRRCEDHRAAKFEIVEPPVFGQATEPAAGIHV